MSVNLVKFFSGAVLESRFRPDVLLVVSLSLFRLLNSENLLVVLFIELFESVGVRTLVKKFELELLVGVFER